MNEFNKDIVKDGIESYLEAKGINIRQPFNCLNPAHRDNKPSMSLDLNRKKAHCFSCNADYDTFDLIGIDYNLTEPKEIFRKAYSLFNLEEKGITPGANIPKARKKEPIDYIKDYKEPTYKPDFTEIIDKAHQELLGTQSALNYLKGRGITLEIIEKYKIGYSKEGHNALLKDFPEHQSGNNKEKIYNLVLPYLDNNRNCYYFITEISDRNEIDNYNGKYRKLNKSKNPDKQLNAQLFNERYLKVKKPPKTIFICEGIYDALSIEEAGGKAIALVGVGQNRLLSLIKTYKPDTTFILFLDNDARGQEATERIRKGLETLKASYETETIKEGKDANEYLQENKEEFKKYIMDIIERTQTKEDKEKEAYIKTSSRAYLQNFVDGIADSVNTPVVPTGFNKLDETLDGGLYEGLYFIGAVSSLGKTTLVLQIADQIAQSGKDILFFSLEMARSEIISKSISRNTLLNVVSNGGNIRNAKTSRGITAGAKYNKYNQEEKNLIKESIEDYGRYADHIYIKEGIGDIGTKEIRQAIENHIKYTGKTPVVIIDYIQILAPYNLKATDKQNTDKNVLELKRISRDFKTAVVGVSSINRTNYKEKIDMQAFKESGSIEYGSDVLIGLQFNGAGGKSFDVNEAKRNNPREVELVILKNRNGRTGNVVNFNYFTLFNYFEEA